MSKKTVLKTILLVLSALLAAAQTVGDSRLLAKLNRAVKIADASNQRKAQSEAFSAVPIAF